VDFQNEVCEQPEELNNIINDSNILARDFWNERAMQKKVRPLEAGGVMGLMKGGTGAKSKER